MNKIFQTRVVIYKKDNLYLGVALDFDLLVQGKSPSQTMARLDDCIGSYLKMCLKDNESDEEIYRKASKKYFDVYNLFLDLQKQKVKSKKEQLKRKYKTQFLGLLQFDNKGKLVNV
jgi:hypothetical protein